MKLKPVLDWQTGTATSAELAITVLDCFHWWKAAAAAVAVAPSALVNVPANSSATRKERNRDSPRRPWLISALPPCVVPPSLDLCYSSQCQPQHHWCLGSSGSPRRRCARKQDWGSDPPGSGAMPYRQPPLPESSISDYHHLNIFRLWVNIYLCFNSLVTWELH